MNFADEKEKKQKYLLSIHPLQHAWFQEKEKELFHVEQLSILILVLSVIICNMDYISITTISI